MNIFLAIFAQSSFWLWNFLFFYVVYLGILPLVGWPMIQAIALGQLPWSFAVSLLLFLLTPVAALVLGIRFIKQPRKILQIFYGFQVPTLVLCGLRLFALRELPGAGSWVLGSLLLSIFAFTFHLIYGYMGDGDRWKSLAPSLRRAIAHGQGILHSIMLLMGLYGGAILLFYALPLTYGFVTAFLSFDWVDEFSRALWDSLRYGDVFVWLPLGLLLLWLSASVLVTAPLFLIGLYVRQGQAVAQRFARQFGKGRAIALGSATLAGWVLVLGLLNSQPQVGIFEQLQTPATTPQAQQALLAQSDRIRQGLLNAYLADYRYVSSISDNNHIRELYRNTFPNFGPNFGPNFAQQAQTLYNSLFSPFLYQDERSRGEDSDPALQHATDERARAAKLYAQFFDQPIQKAESKTIRRALNATAYRDQAKAGLLNIDQKKVHLAQQRLSLSEHGDWAEVELYEVYKNQTNDVQEVYYSFSLPESAVLTGVWLGDTADLSQRFQPQVSPRGAAQKVYNSQVQRVNPVDPALLEQVGPRHYRLRAFPVPPRVPDWAAVDTTLEDQPTEMHLWLTYQVMKTEAGWPLPQLGEQRNIFWDGKTQRSYRVQPESSPGTQQTEIMTLDPAIAPTQAWLPATIPAQTAAAPTEHRFQLENYEVRVTPLTAQDYVLPQNQRFAIVLDSSRSMAQHRDELVSTFQWLKQQGFADNQFRNNDGDLFIPQPPNSAPPQRLDDLRNFDPQRFNFFGSLQLQQMLQQFDQLRGDTPYDGIIVLTDGDTYELSETAESLPQLRASLNAPLWMVHLGQFPPAYEDGVLELIQDSGGGVDRAIAHVLQRSATEAQLGPNVRVRDGYAWSVSPSTMTVASTSATQASSPSPSFTPLAVRRWIEQLGQTSGTEPEQLDRIHGIAKRHRIVTPYSSMIVLVNDEQRRLLAEAEAAADRFERSVETGEETLETPFNPLNSSTSVPEASPLTPVLTAGAALLLLKRRRQFLSSTKSR